MLLNLLERPGDPFAAARRLLPRTTKPAPASAPCSTAPGHLRELLATGVVERLEEPDEYGNRLALTVHLQQNFALNQPLSPFALAALELLDKDAPSYALDVVSVIEATLEKPRQMLSAQEKKARGEAVAAMKSDGIDYDAADGRRWTKSPTRSRWPSCSRTAFETYRHGAPWLGDFELAPKSVIRDMYERAMNFAEFVSSMDWPGPKALCSAT